MPNFLTLGELKGRLHITFDDDDGELAGYLAAAESYLGDPQNGILHRPVVAQEFTETFAGFAEVQLAFPDEVSAVSVAYADAEGLEQTLPEGFTLADGRLMRAPGATWPRARRVTVTYTAGWLPGQVPRAICEAGYFIARSFYEQGDKIDPERFRSVIAIKVAGFRRATL